MYSLAAIQSNPHHDGYLNTNGRVSITGISTTTTTISWCLEANLFVDLENYPVALKPLEGFVAPKAVIHRARSLNDASRVWSTTPKPSRSVTDRTVLQEALSGGSAVGLLMYC